MCSSVFPIPLEINNMIGARQGKHYDNLPALCPIRSQLFAEGIVIMSFDAYDLIFIFCHVAIP
jgi:hypothetical protein